MNGIDDECIGNIDGNARRWIFILILERYDGVIWTRLIWFRIWTSGGLL
jgi:hypothetical protein